MNMKPVVGKKYVTRCDAVAECIEYDETTCLYPYIFVIIEGEDCGREFTTTPQGTVYYNIPEHGFDLMGEHSKIQSTQTYYWWIYIDKPAVKCQIPANKVDFERNNRLIDCVKV